MPKEIKHTPLPWFAARDFDDSWAVLVTLNFSGNIRQLSVAKGLTQEDAEFIVRACNTHYKILNDLRFIRDLANAHSADALHSDVFTPERIVQLCNEAIAKAEGK